MNAREQAIRLRKEGYTYTYISSKTGLGKSTLSYHLRDVPYVPNKITLASIGNARSKSAETKARRKQETIIDAREYALKDIGTMTKRDLFMLGLGIYIGEGSKTQDLIRLVNTDHRVINVFIRWLSELGFNKNNFVIRIHLYPDSDIKKAREYWSLKTRLPISQFQKECIDRRANKDLLRSKKHQYGTAHVTVRSNGNKDLGVNFSRKVGAWMEKVLE